MQIKLFQTRFENGYNIYNEKDYISWLELNHPEAAPSNLTCIDTATSLLDSFSDVSHATPVLLSDQSVFESESYAISPSGVDSSPMSGSPVPPASTSVTFSPANLSSPFSVVSLSHCVGSSPTSGSPVPPASTSITVSPANLSSPLSKKN